MAVTHSAIKKRPFGKAIFYGVITAILYAAAFAKADIVMQFFTKGGYYAALPIATVFVFSFAHGAFASSLWSVLGIEPLTKQPAVRPRVPAPRPAQRPRPRLRLSL